MEVVWFARSGQAAEDQEVLLGFSVPLELSESHPVSVTLLAQVMTFFGVSPGSFGRAVSGGLFCTNHGIFLVFPLLILQPEASDSVALLPPPPCCSQTRQGCFRTV